MSDHKIGLLSLAPLNVGGAERNMLQLAGGLSSEFDFFIIGPMTDLFEAQASALAPDAVLVPVSRPSKFDITAPWKLRKITRDLGLNALHTHDARGRLIAHMLPQKSSCVFIHTYHMSPLFYAHGAVKRRLYERIEALYNHKKSDLVIFVSGNVLGMYRDLNLCDASTVAVIHNGIDTSDYSQSCESRTSARVELRMELGADAEAVVCTFVGRMTDQKGIDVLLESLQHIGLDLMTQEDVHIVLIGDGENQSALKSLSHASGLSDRVHFLGVKTTKEVSVILGGSDVFLLPSRYECFPYTILEAMASGLACIVTDVGGNTEMIVDSETGLVVPAQDADSFAHALLRLIRSRSERDKMKDAAMRAVREFSVERMIEETRQAYRAVLSQ